MDTKEQAKKFGVTLSDYSKHTRWGWRDYLGYVFPFLGAVGEALGRDFVGLVWIILATLWYTLYTGEVKKHWATRQELMNSYELHGGFLKWLQRPKGQ